MTRTAPRSQMLVALVAVGLAGCNLYEHGAVSDARERDASDPDPIDGRPIDAFRVPAMITISGVASARSGSGAQPIGGITVTAYQASDLATPLAAMTTGSDGSYALPIATHAMAVEVVLETSSPSYVVTYDDLSFLSWDTPDVALDMFTPAAYAAAYSSTGVPHVAGSAMLEIQLQDLVQGITLTSSTGTVEYTSGDLITGSGASTGFDGIGFVLGATAGPDDVTAFSRAFDVSNYANVRGIGDALLMATLQLDPPVGGD